MEKAVDVSYMTNAGTVCQHWSWKHKFEFFKFLSLHVNYGIVLRTITKFSERMY